jgi:tRNA-splicing ligase RtcB
MPPPETITAVADCVWEIPPSWRPGMRVPIRIYASAELLGAMDDAVFQQAANVARLPGIVGASLVMPDAHWGYGFPIGGVAAMDPESGVISPGGIGFDINCGMRLAMTTLTLEEVTPRLRTLVDRLAERVPAGVGCHGSVSVSQSEFAEVLCDGAGWAVRRGFGTAEDLARTEENGCFAGADPGAVSPRAMQRGREQIGTLGSGNHYLEIQVVRREDIADPAAAAAFGIEQPNQVAVMFHCGSRGFGHQVASDAQQSFLPVMHATPGLELIERELACAPFASSAGQQYFAAMQCAANMSLANRQVILHRVREVFGDVFRRDPFELGLRTAYDVAHNTAKLETHIVDGAPRSVLVHRKGATRAFAAGNAELPSEYARIGQPVIIGGSMETGSYLLAGQPGSAATFGSTAHGSGRTMSRTQAKKRFQGRELQRSMEDRGIYVRTASYAGLAEEAGGAYKDIDAVVEATERAGLSRRVARFSPIGNVKG